MEVVDVPQSKPIITEIKSHYRIGELIRGNCSSQYSKPAANLTWLINDMPVWYNWTFFIDAAVDINFNCFFLFILIFCNISLKLHQIKWNPDGIIDKTISTIERWIWKFSIKYNRIVLATHTAALFKWTFEGECCVLFH